ncbi:DUF4186 domain-containing protein [Entomomonas asaccharolytica]|uniref:DUF4186 domain-containing protein n=1 Tax=Entomomonas asaccharolytica TaxID=2785331 RepID=A0A974RW26_9GAMM|nr:DUF4186 domain-containing protein [Entomomonas asaccharolytica]QQP84637.1 DUF4186 domain-containing protein [Entomomonas asaccharolytica]
MPTSDDLAALMQRLNQSKFRRSIALNSKDYFYLQQKGKQLISQHAADFIAQRLAPAQPVNDGKQTPWKGHPVFVAQHATATCCRSCLQKWHGITKNQPLTATQQQYIVTVIMYWLDLGKVKSIKNTSRNLSLL